MLPDKHALKTHFSLALLIRLLFTAFGLYHDHASESEPTATPKYTDIDYHVFSDAARHVRAGESPYERDTYRYTPLLALLMQPNVLLTPSFGKCVFVLFDLLCGWLIVRINGLNGIRPADAANTGSLLFWFYNPVTIAISSRGNAESVMAFLVLVFVYLLKRGDYLLAGVSYAVAIHFKIYPVVYGLAVLLYITGFSSCNVFRLVFDKRVLVFGGTFAVTLAAITAFFYVKYGWTFLFETYLYHVVRQDNRHNFSPYFYLIYLTNITWQNSVILKLFYFLPQLVSVLVASCALYQHIELCFFVLTVLFVSFNKYFVWYLCLLPVVLPKLRIGFLKGLLMFGIWMLGQALWLYFAYELEFNGKNTFFMLWISGLVFLAVNCGLLKYAVLDTYEFKLKTN